MRTVLVTGGNGFIGRYVVEELLWRGYHVSVLDTRWRPTVDGATVVLGDIRDEVAVTEAAAHSDGIIHLAGVLGTQETIKNPRPAAATNVLGGLNVMEAALQYGLPMVNIAVGNYWMNNTYSITKNTVERFAEMLNKYRDGRIAVLRALNAYGPRQTPAAPYGPSKVRKIMPSFICRALAGEPIEVYGDGDQIMDMIYVADVARCLVSALESTAAGGPLQYVSEVGAEPRTFEAGSGRRTSVNEIATLVAEEIGRQIGRTPVITHAPMRPGEDERSVVLGDPETLTVIGVTPEEFIPLEEGVRRTVAHFIEERA